MADVQHIVIAGKTGSGKSLFGTALLHQFFMHGWRIVLVDVGASIDTFSRDRERATIARPWLWDGKRLGNVTYYVPSLPGWQDEALERLYEQAMSQANTVIYHDEIVGLATENQAPNGLKIVYTQGRKRRVIGAICTQRPVCIPRECLTQAGIIAAFKMTDEDDAKKIAKRIHNTAIMQAGAWKQRYSFFLYNEMTMDAAQYCPPLTRRDILEHGSRPRLSGRA